MPETSPAPERQGPDDRQSIRDVVETWQRATSAGDLPRILDLMDDDATFLIPGQPPMRGKDRFAAGFRSVIQRYRFDGSSRIEEIAVAGEWAYCWAFLTVIITPLAGGSSLRRSGNTLSIFRKKADGRWVLFRDANLMAEEPQIDL